MPEHVPVRHQDDPAEEYGREYPTFMFRALPRYDVPTRRFMRKQKEMYREHAVNSWR